MMAGHTFEPSRQITVKIVHCFTMIVNILLNPRFVEVYKNICKNSNNFFVKVNDVFQCRFQWRIESLIFEKVMRTLRQADALREKKMKLYSRQSAKYLEITVVHTREMQHA
ncbi:MAG: hypothetical protein EZS28_015489 [Streblomastix strix]|uniref:Uncharacterized protein n=1 Tax=Streblomastix strix TaxID=222440 RepID=A0A5J4W344_9EUKA|nr:MAG: hypothetical protein EZS28_015489 [Streblomastix strix]